ncbi:MAG: peptide chain release factor 2 [Mailhella sp.]|nr:peptide chain release factor 2 [Mailhella sp.]
MLQLTELRAQCGELAEQFHSLWGRLDQAGKQSRLADVEKSISSPDVWGDQEKLTPLLKEKSRLEAEIQRCQELKSSYDEMEEWLELVDGGEEEALEMLDGQIAHVRAFLAETELDVLLSGASDRCDAILDIHPGAGGTEAQDWAEMLERMYLRWAESRKFRTQIIDYLPGEEAGIKSVTIRIQGENAYGLLQGEKGIHRLIRLSPYDASGRRHTSFASVDLIPDASEELDIEIKESDLRIDVYRSSGAGGQHVNKTESAVRITHLPTGIVAQCQNERSQQSNRESAMRVLKARLYAFEQSKRDAARQADYAGKDAIAFGSQIRTYTLHPYHLVKDHRTGFERGDVETVLNGDLDSFLREFLLWKYGTKA